MSSRSPRPSIPAATRRWSARLSCSRSSASWPWRCTAARTACGACERLLSRVAGGRVDRDDDAADRPEREPGKLQVGPGEGQADNRRGLDQRDAEMAQRQPPAGEHEPYDIAENAGRAGAEIVIALVLRARHRAAS